MLRMIEVVETSEKGYSEAVLKAIKKLKEKGGKVHFFKLVEPRGAVRGDSIEFQVVLSVAVEIE